MRLQDDGVAGSWEVCLRKPLARRFGVGNRICQHSCASPSQRSIFPDVANYVDEMSISHHHPGNARIQRGGRSAHHPAYLLSQTSFSLSKSSHAVIISPRSLADPQSHAQCKKCTASASTHSDATIRPLSVIKGPTCEVSGRTHSMRSRFMIATSTWGPTGR
jgi:hypothetical protein